jgi:hypothetical protein
MTFRILAFSDDHSEVATIKDYRYFYVDFRFGFSWPADLTSEKTVDRLQERNFAVVARQKEIWHDQEIFDQLSTLFNKNTILQWLIERRKFKTLKKLSNSALERFMG